MNQTLLSPRRYRDILIFFFFFVSVLSGIFILNSVISHRHSKNNLSILVSNQTLLNLYGLNQDWYDLSLVLNQEMQRDEILRNIQQKQSNIELHLGDLKAGLINYHGMTAELALDDLDRHEIEQAYQAWHEFSPLLQQFRQNPAAETFNAMVHQFQSVQQRVVQHLNAASRYVQEHRSILTSYIPWIQYAAIAFCWLMFLALMLVFIRRLKQNDQESNEIQQEINDIMATVNEGLFLLDEKMNLGGQYSQSLPKIIGREHIANINLRTLLEKMVNPSQFETVNQFINQLFKPRIKQNLIHDLNPLDRIKVQIERGRSEEPEEKWLSFFFNRVYHRNQKSIKNILVSVRDITKAVHMEERLENERQKSNQQIELLVAILRGDHRLLQGFLRNAHAIGERINSILRRPTLRAVDLRHKIDDIFREAHSLKGEASAMELSTFVDLANGIEEKLKRLNSKAVLLGDDFLSITVELDHLMHLIERAEFLMKRLSGIQFDASGNWVERIEQINQSEEEQLREHFKQFANQVAIRHNKYVKIDLLGFEEIQWPEKIMDRLRDIMTQMIRNAIVHGIESPAQRAEKGKDRYGNISIELEQDGSHRVLSIQDDGRGIDLRALRAKAATLAQFKNSDVAKLPREVLYKVLFISGFSTAERESEDAGRGVGMDVIRDRIRDLQGHISIRSVENEYTKFSIRFPNPTEES